MTMPNVVQIKYFMHRTVSIKMEWHECTGANGLIIWLFHIDGVESLQGNDNLAKHSGQVPYGGLATAE